MNMIITIEFISYALNVLFFVGGIFAFIYIRNKPDLAIENQNLLDEVQQLRTDLALAKQSHESANAQLNNIQVAKADITVKLEKANQVISDLEADKREQSVLISSERDKVKALKQQFDEQKEGFKSEFKSLSEEILKLRQEDLKKQNDANIKALLEPLDTKIENFQKRINEVHEETRKGNITLGVEIKNVIDLSSKMRDEANNLTLALKGDSQKRGAWGEVQLERTLEMSGLIENTHYEKQTSFNDENSNRRQTDFIIKLPSKKHIIIDSKVSLNAYESSVAVSGDEETVKALDEHVKAVKKHIDDLSSKDYEKLTGMNSPDFVLMFMPIEPAYIEALKHSKDLYSYGYERNVILVSHTTLFPILRTVANLWMMDKSNKEAREISDRAGEIYNSVCLVANRFLKLGNTLNTASKQFDDTVTSLAGAQGLQSKVRRFTELSKKANKEMPTIEPKHIEFDTNKLDIEPLSIEHQKSEEIKDK